VDKGGELVRIIHRVLPPEFEAYYNEVYNFFQENIFPTKLPAGKYSSIPIQNNVPSDPGKEAA
jgi:hypothetical protein